ncbi:MAG: hypothetical protein GC158_01225 [Cyanobacteria bacterium RI_101]|nr:hypothetical protein [Cyanobacteria bacterium RI_101]
MLALILAATVALASLIFFFSAFFAPKLHRQDDFFWSGIGLFYALVLWVCAQRLTGGVLLGQLAAVALILGFAWQTLKLRSALANSAVPLESPGFSFLGWLQGGRRTTKPPQKMTAPTPAPAVVEPVAPEIPEPAEIPPAPTAEVNVPETPSEVVAEAVPEEVNPPEPVSTPNPKPAPVKAKGKPWQGLFGKKSPPKTEPLDSEDWDEPEPGAVSAAVAEEILEELEELENLGAEALESSDAVTVIESVVQIVKDPAPEPESLTAPSETLETEIPENPDPSPDSPGEQTPSESP